jgi:hypothetical protein
VSLIELFQRCEVSNLYILAACLQLKIDHLSSHSSYVTYDPPLVFDLSSPVDLNGILETWTVPDAHPSHAAWTTTPWQSCRLPLPRPWWASGLVSFQLFWCFSGFLDVKSYISMCLLCDAVFLQVLPQNHRVQVDTEIRSWSQTTVEQPQAHNCRSPIVTLATTTAFPPRNYA